MVNPHARRFALSSLPLLFSARASLAQPATPPSPTGRDMPSIARTYYENGSRAFAEGRFEEACNAFRESHAIAHRPELLFNIGRSCAEAGHLQQSLDALSLFESAGSPGVERAALAELVASVRQRLQGQSRGTPDGGVVLNAGNDLPPPPPPSPPPPPPPPETRVFYQHSTFSQVGPWIALGVGIASGVVGLLGSADAAARVGQVRMATTGMTPWSPTISQAYDGAPGVIASAWIFTTLGAGLVTTGALWLALRGPGQRREMPVHVGVAPVALDARGAVISLGGAF